MIFWPSVTCSTSVNIFITKLPYLSLRIIKSLSIWSSMPRNCTLVATIGSHWCELMMLLAYFLAFMSIDQTTNTKKGHEEVLEIYIYHILYSMETMVWINDCFVSVSSMTVGLREEKCGCWWQVFLSYICKNNVKTNIKIEVLIGESLFELRILYVWWSNTLDMVGMREYGGKRALHLAKYLL